MAGAGYKLFNTGDVLTAAQVNTYLQEQTVMVFADSTARTTALAGVLAEGMVTYLKDTNAIEKYTGAAWVNIDSGSTSPLTTKGDIYTYSTTDARLAVGNNGESLVADSGATTGLRWNPKPNSNPFLNAAAQVWQRGTSFSFNNNTAYTADRWCCTIANTAATVSRQTTSDTTNLPFIQYCIRLARNSGTTNTGSITLTQSIETSNSIPFVGKTVTFSFYARAGANYSSASNALSVYLVTGTGTDQNQATGFTGQATPIAQTATLTTTWQRFSYTGTIATTATQVALNISYTPSGTAGAADYFEITGIQLELGSVATSFETAMGTLAGELQAAQRYYIRYNALDAYSFLGSLGFATSTTNVTLAIPLPSYFRARAASIDYSALTASDGVTNLTATPALSVYQSVSTVTVDAAVTGATQYRPYNLRADNNSAAYIGFSAEL